MVLPVQRTALILPHIEYGLSLSSSQTVSVGVRDSGEIEQDEALEREVAVGDTGTAHHPNGVHSRALDRGEGGAGGVGEVAIRQPLWGYTVW